MAFYLSGYQRVLRHNNVPLIIYVDEGWGEENLGNVERHVLNVCSENPDFLQESQYGICFAWRHKEKPMLDVWKFAVNYVDDISGPIADVCVFCDTQKESGAEVASGNTLVVLGLEEQHRRESTNFESYLEVRPELVSWLVKG